MPLFNTTVDLTPEISGSVALADVLQIKGAFKVYDTTGSRDAVTLDQFSNNQIIYVSESNELFRAEKIEANPPFVFTPSLTWHPFSWPDSAGAINTGSLLVTASISSSFIVFEKGDSTTFSLELPSAFPFTGSAEITGSLSVIGTSTFNNQVIIQGDSTVDPFVITSSYIDNKNPFKINNEGVAVFGEQLSTPTAVAGGVIYSASTFYFGFE